MKFDLDMLVSAKIDKNGVEQIVKQAVEESTGRKVAQIEVKVGTRYEGYGHGEHQVTYFDGVLITFEKEKV